MANKKISELPTLTTGSILSSASTVLVQSGTSYNTVVESFVTAAANGTAEVTVAPSHWWVLVGGALKRMTHAGWLALVRAACGIVHLATGGTLTLGTTAKTLTVSADADTANITTAAGKAAADGATATPAANKVPIADANGQLVSWIPAASTTVAGKVTLPNSSGFSPMPVNTTATILPSTTGLTVGQKGSYRSDDAFTLPAGGTWEYDVDKVTFPVTLAAAPITSINFSTPLNIKYLGADYYAFISYNGHQLTIDQWTGKTLVSVATYAVSTTGLAVLSPWDGSSARLVTLFGTGANCTALVLVFNGTTITLESTNSLPVGFYYSYINVTSLSATRIVCINGNGSTTSNDDLLYVFDYDINAKTWAQVGTAYSVPIYIFSSIITLSSTDVAIISGSGANNTILRLTFNNSTWAQVGTDYNLYVNHPPNFMSFGHMSLYKEGTVLVSQMHTTIPQKLIVLQWDKLNLRWIPVSPKMQRVSTETNQSSFGYGNGILFWCEITNHTIYPYIFPAGELRTRYAGTAAGGTTLCNAVLGESFIGSVKKIQ